MSPTSTDIDTQPWNASSILKAQEWLARQSDVLDIADGASIDTLEEVMDEYEDLSRGLHALVFCHNKDGKSIADIATNLDLHTEDFGEVYRRLGVMVDVVARIVKARLEVEAAMQKKKKPMTGTTPQLVSAEETAWKALFKVLGVLDFDDNEEFEGVGEDVPHGDPRWIEPVWKTLIQPLLNLEIPKAALLNCNPKDLPLWDNRAENSSLLHSLLENRALDQDADYSYDSESYKLSLLNRLVREGCDPCFQDPITGQTLLHIAAQNNYLKIALRLLELDVPLEAVTTGTKNFKKDGAGVEYDDDSASQTVEKGETALMWACRRGNIKMVAILAKHSKKKNAPLHGKRKTAGPVGLPPTKVVRVSRLTKMAVAMSKNFQPAVEPSTTEGTCQEALIANASGQTPLHVVCSQKHSEIALLLLGMEPKILETSRCLKDNEGKTPFDIATNQGLQNVTSKMIQGTLEQNSLRVKMGPNPFLQKF